MHPFLHHFKIMKLWYQIAHPVPAVYVPNLRRIRNLAREICPSAITRATPLQTASQVKLLEFIA